MRRLAFAAGLLAALAALAAHREEVPGIPAPAGRKGRLVSGVEILCVSIAGPGPQLREVNLERPEAFGLAKIDLRGGLSRELGYLARTANGRPLHVFLPDAPDDPVAHAGPLVPVPGRSDRAFQTFEVKLHDGTVTQLREPLQGITIPRHIAASSTPGALSSMLKHELAHVLHAASVPLATKGYSETFGLHTGYLRTNDVSALAEGFAEFSAHRFRDGAGERRPGPLKPMLYRDNPAAYRTLLQLYWERLRSHRATRTRIAPATLDAIERRIYAKLPRDGRLPSPEQFRELIVASLAGQGKPPMAAEVVRRGLMNFEQVNRVALGNLRDEQWTEPEIRQFAQAVLDGAKARLRGGASDPEYERATARMRSLRRRSPIELMMTEGVVTALLDALDAELSKTGLDFYAKVLEAMRQDPYEGRCLPANPVNLKELLHLLNRDPSLAGKIVPLVERVTDGGITAWDLQLSVTRESDPLHLASAGEAMR